MELTEQIVMNCLFSDDGFVRKAMPYIEREYFQTESNKIVFDMMKVHIEKYNELPSRESLLVSLDDVNVSENIYKEILDFIEYLNKNKDEHKNSLWQLDATEKWCKDRALYNAVMKSINIINEDSSSEKGNMPKILQEALAVSFDTHIGHDFIDDYEERFEFYQRVEEKIPFHLEKLNEITKGGLPKKTLNIALAGTGVGKSLFMCDCAANHLAMGYDVLYITCEMSEEKIAERIDANLLDTSIQDVSVMRKTTFDRKIEKLKKKTTGKLIIKEYPTAVANANHFRHLLNELHLKKNFKPKIMYIDYLNICASSRIKLGNGANSYTLVKSIAEELRGLAVENEVPIVSATQTTRSGYSSSDVDLTDTSESFGLPATADLMFALISTEELEDMSQILVKQLKNRYNDPNENKRFVVGIDRPKMRLYDVEDIAQEELINDRVENDFKSSFSKSKSKKLGNVEITI